MRLALPALALTLPATLAIVATADAQCPTSASAVVTQFPIHSMDRPQPPVVTPASAGAPVPPPSDAIVLFDGRDLSQWRSVDSADSPARWKVRDGYMEVVDSAGDIRTARAFGDVQLHVEWMAPLPAEGESQERGNSGVYLMSTFEVQVLDSWHNLTYPDGQAAAVYGQYPPSVNANRAPGEWQTYDIIFHRPRFNADNSLRCAARVTVLFNGVLVQEDAVLTGPTAHKRRPPYTPIPDRLPLLLQDHGNKVRYRDIWARELPDGR